MRTIQRPSTALDPAIESGRLRLGVDAQGGLIDQWKRTAADPDVVETVVTYWYDHGGIVSFDSFPRIDPGVSRNLRLLGFPSGGIDRLVLKLGLKVDNRTIVSNDSHFWKPGNPRSVGDDNAPVARLCRDELGVIIIILTTLVQNVG